jgi:hypothetical protein
VTPWVEYADAYTGGCQVTPDNDNCLLISAVAPSPPLRELSPAIGLHLVDAQIGPGNLVALVHSELGVWEKKLAKATAKTKARHHH